MKHASTVPATRTHSLQTIGIDVGDRRSHACVVDGSREIVEEFSFETYSMARCRHLLREPCQVILEVGPHSRWMQKCLSALGHTVRVVDARKIHLISRSMHKTDRRDARTLAQLGAGVPEVLGEIRHRTDQAQADLTVLHTRDHLVRMRTATILRVRGVLKSSGIQVPNKDTRAFHRHVVHLLPAALRDGLMPLIDELESLHDRIRALDKKIAAIATRYPMVPRLTAITGVGTLTGLAYVLCLDDPRRFKKSRDVGPYIGLTPAKHASGQKDPQLSITRSGNSFLRRLLVQSGHYVLGPFGPPCLLRSHGQRIVERGGKYARKRAVVAVARKLAVLMHRLWLNETPYDPWYRSKDGPPPNETKTNKVSRKTSAATN
jgi:transposase